MQNLDLTTSFQASIGSDKYLVYVSRDADKALASHLASFDPDSVFIVADAFFRDSRNLPSNTYKNLLSSYCTYFVQGGIESKSIHALESLCDQIFLANIPRDGVIVAVGGGVVGDLAAMAASIYQRGVNLIHVPTTSTSMLDSSIGGKTGINHQGQVNLLGTYYNPAALFCDSRFLNTLSPRDLVSGICESIKKSLLSGEKELDFFIDNSEKILALSPSHLHELIVWSIKKKLFYVSSDFKESSTRLLLNYGHTFGQAFESFYGLHQDFLRHGEAVSLGICCAGEISHLIFGNTQISQIQKKALSLYSLPSTLSDLAIQDRPSLNDLMPLLQNDKKRIAKGNRYVLLESIGAPTVVNSINSASIEQAFSSVLG